MKLDRKLCMGFMRALLTISIGIYLPGCSLTGEAFSGYVLEQGTESPIEGAIVVAGWKGHVATWAHGRTVCYHVETAVTDSNGRFHFPAWRKDISEKWQKNVRFERVSIEVYKSGYERPSSFLDGRYYLQIFNESASDRLRQLDQVVSSTACPSAGDSYRNLHQLFRAVYKEAKQVSQTLDEKKHAERFGYLAADSLADKSKSVEYDERGRLISVNPNNSFRAGE